MVDLSEDPPTDINPYEVLELATTASPSDVKSAYKKLALKHHPDKVQHHERESAHSRFQEIALAYAILSDERRRKRYDTTGNTSESLEIEDDGFNWFDWYKALWADMVTGRKISDFESQYKHSEEERQGILIAYKMSQGDLDKIFGTVMLSNPLEDEERFREILNDAIAAGEVEAYRAFTHEKEDKRRRRHKRACGEGREAEEHAKKLGIWDDLFGNKTKSKSNAKDPDAALMDMIQKRKKGASTQFLDNLEAKYGGQQQKGKKRKFEEPPEELFQKNHRKTQKVRKDEAEVEADEEKEEEDIDLEVDSSDSGSEKDEEEDTVKPTKAKVNNSKGSATRKKANAKKNRDVQDLKDNKSAKSNGDGIKGNPKKKKKKKKKGAASTTKLDDEEQTSPTKKGRSSRQARSTRG